MSDHKQRTPLRMQLSSEERLRVLLLTNEDGEHDYGPGLCDGFARLQDDGSIGSFVAVAPIVIAKTKGVDGALREILDVARARQPNVIVKISPQAVAYNEEWFKAIASADPRPILLHWEGDAWGRWTKPTHSAMRLWWRTADVVFTVAIGKQRRLIQQHGGRDVRFIPNTYDHIRHHEEEATEPSMTRDSSEVVVIGNRWGNRFVSRLPGARQRFRLVRRLQRDPRIPLAVYGHNWTGRGARGPIPMAEQAAVAREALLTANWDHFPDHAAFYSDRLATQLLAGRAHVTTLHPNSEWLPGPEKGLFLEPTVDAAIRRIRELLARPREEVLELGLAGHRWVRHRLSYREMARYVLGAVDERLLRQLPDDPWRRLPT